MLDTLCLAISATLDHPERHPLRAAAITCCFFGFICLTFALIS